MKPHPRRGQGKPRQSPSVLERINPDAAGIDCGATEHDVAVPPDRDHTPVQRFATFTTGLQQFADWLTACRIRTVAMEATGVDGIPVYELLEGRGFEVLLVTARHLNHVAGRRSDVLDCEWRRDRHIVGLLRGSFRPTDAIVTWRGYLRHRQLLIELTSGWIQRMQKALVQMNRQLPLVVSDVSGVTSLRLTRVSRSRGRRVPPGSSGRAASAPCIRAPRRSSSIWSVAPRPKSYKRCPLNDTVS